MSDLAWFTGALVRDPGWLRSARMSIGAGLCHTLGQFAGRGLEGGDVATLREVLDVLDRLYALENALSPDWRTR